MERKKLPIGIQHFPDLISGGYTYIDKTEYIFRMMDEGKYYFLSRPRRFGKSLLISTLQEIFLGSKALFEGLWIYDKLDWEPRPVILLDFSELMSKKLPLEVSINNELDRIAASYGLVLKAAVIDQKFRELIETLGSKRQIAILVDEYDKPITDYIHDPVQAEANREEIKNLYSVIKGNDRHIAFVLLTGIAKFPQVSVFSDLNNLNDISVGHPFAAVLGYTQVELETYFSSYIAELADRQQAEKEEIIEKIKRWYDGYSWDGAAFVYNPFSILRLFFEMNFRDFWWQTGTPTFLLNLVRQNQYSIFDLSGKEVSTRSFDKVEISRLDIRALLFQTGYLTIKELDWERGTVVLDFPNREVENAFSYYLLSEYVGQSQMDGLLLKLQEALIGGAVSRFVELLKTMFASITYPNIEAKEAYYHTVFYLSLKLLGYQIESEVLTNKGRIDAVIHTPSYIYIVEFKLGDAASALAQIREKEYHERYWGANQHLILLGIGFDVEAKNIGGYEKMEYN